MKLYLKERIISWFDSYNIYDENDDVFYKVKGQLSWGHKVKIYDKDNNEIGVIKEKIITLLPQFIMYDKSGKEIGKLKKHLTFLKPHYTLDCNDWDITGNIWGWNYKVVDKNNKTIMTASKKLFRLSDTYEIDVKNKKDALLALMIVISIDLDKCTEGE